MTVFRYDKSFEGLLTAVFCAYSLRLFPSLLADQKSPLPLFCSHVSTVVTDSARADRVWQGLQKKLPPAALSILPLCWLSEQPDVDLLLFRYICKIVGSSHHFELNFSDDDVRQVTQTAKKVANERLRVIQFLRFQKAADGTFFAAVKPVYNVLPLTLDFLTDRFADQTWLLYDLHRAYGFYYDQHQAVEVRFESHEQHFVTGLLDADRMDPSEPLFQQMWKQYFTSIAIRERINPRLHRQHMPARFWPFMPEKR